jgi:hypothetical protein
VNHRARGRSPRIKTACSRPQLELTGESATYFGPVLHLESEAVSKRYSNGGMELPIRMGTVRVSSWFEVVGSRHTGASIGALTSDSMVR